MTSLQGPRVRHLVVFALRHADDSPEAASFLAALRSLGEVEGVEELEVVRQVGRENGYRFAVSMEFADQAAYDAYDAHPQHVAFVRDRWVPEVADFLEIDLAGLPAAD